MLKLYHAPMSCSLASRLTLAECNIEHELVIVRTWLAEQSTENYRKINPRGKVPALVTGDGILTESAAILPYIADLSPERKLFPPAGSFARARGQALLSYLSSTLHASLSLLMFPPAGCDEDAARDAAAKKVAGEFQWLNEQLSDREYLNGDFSICDLYLIVFAMWRAAPNVNSQLPAFPNVDRLQHRLMGRPAIATVITNDMQTRFAG
jgi:glutathione S-transferase